MTKEEQIKEASSNIEYSLFYNVDDELKETLIEIFQLGAKWDEEHPYWHNLKDNSNDLPIEKGEYLTCNSVGKIEISQWRKFANTDYGWYGTVELYLQYPIIAWMELPKFKE